MRSKERFVYMLVNCVLAVGLVLAAVRRPRAESSGSFRHLEIQDSAGNARIILGTDSDGTAEMRFVGGNGKKTSYLRQFMDGSTSLRFAGRTSRPSVLIDAMLLGPGPIVSLQGNTEDQMIYLGAADYQDDVPSASAQAHGWGLYVPAGGFKPPYAAIGVRRDRQTGKIAGFVSPER